MSIKCDVLVVGDGSKGGIETRTTAMSSTNTILLKRKNK